MKTNTHEQRRSTYQLDCVCGAHITTENTTLTCKKCGRKLVIDWDRTAAPSSKNNVIEMRKGA